MMIDERIVCKSWTGMVFFFFFFLRLDRLFRVPLGYRVVIGVRFGS